MINTIRFRIPTLGLLIASLSLFVSCGKNGKKEKKEGDIQTYQVTTVNPQDITLNTNFPATLQGRQNVEIRSKVDGYLQAAYVDEGGIVRKGQVLFRISSPQYEEAVRNAAAVIRSAESAVATAQMEVEKVKPLVEKDIISKYELQSAQLNLQAKKAELAQVKANLANAKANLAYTRIISPVNGTIGLIPYKIGSLISASSAEPLTTVSDTRIIYAYFSLNEKQMLDFSRNYPGKTLKEKLKNMPPVSLLLSDGSEYPEKGKVETVSGLIDTETGSATFRAAFPNPAGLIRSGGSAILRIPKNLNSVIVIPQSATYEMQNKRFALIVKPDNTVLSTAVTTKASDNGQNFIVMEGLKAGDKIVLEGVSLLKDSTKIKPKMVANILK